MIARLTVALPYSLTVPLGEQYGLYDYEDDGLTVRVRLPVKSDRVMPFDTPDELKMDGKASRRLTASLLMMSLPQRFLLCPTM